jgi:uncharacterized protein YndB with AHSA1/START domain
MAGDTVHFVSADDTHGAPIMLAAEKAGLTPEAFIAGMQESHERDLRAFGVEVDHYDFRTGGSYKYTHSDESGTYGFTGVFHTVRENEFALQTFEFDGYPDVVAMDYMHFERLGKDRCRIVGHSVYPTQEARDGMAASGMEQGLSQGYERLSSLLAAV